MATILPEPAVEAPVSHSLRCYFESRLANALANSGSNMV
jgi:hypothetical protein